MAVAAIDRFVHHSTILEMKIVRKAILRL